MFDLLPRGMRAMYISARSGLPRGTESELLRLQNLQRYVPGTVRLQGLDVQYVDGPSLASAYRAIFGQHVYAFALDGDVGAPRLVDGGANVGLATLYWKLLSPSARVEAFEPDHDVFQALKRNVSSLTDVSLHEMAIWSSNGEISFVRKGGDAGHITTGDGDATVRTIALSDVLADSVDYLKLDIEGAESAAVLSASDRLRMAKRLFIEYHSFVDQRQTLAELLACLQDVGFRYWIDTEFAPRVALNSVESDDGMDMRLNISALRID